MNFELNNLYFIKINGGIDSNTIDKNLLVCLCRLFSSTRFNSIQ